MYRGRFGGCTLAREPRCELRGLTQIRSRASAYPAVTALQSLAAACRSVLGAGTKFSYAADWSEYFGHQPQGGSGDVFFHLDPLWADRNIEWTCTGFGPVRCSR